MTLGVNQPNRILLISSDANYTRRATEALRTSASRNQVSVAVSVIAGRSMLSAGFDVVLLDVLEVAALSAVRLATTLAMIHRTSPHTVVVVLAGTEHIGVALSCVLNTTDEVVLRHDDATPLLAQVLTRASQRRRLQELELLMLRSLTHDLNGVFQTVGLVCSLIDKDGDDRIRTFTARARRANCRGIVLVADLAELTRGAFAGTLPLSMARADLGRLAVEAVEAASIAYPDREICADGPRCRALMDERRISRLLSVALAAVVLHTKPDSALELVVSATKTTVAVELRAARFPANLWDRAPFARSLIQTIVHAHNGTVDLECAADAGAVVAVQIPRGAPAKRPQFAARS